MKKKMLTLLTVGALLAQSSGAYAMGQRGREAWESPRVQAARGAIVGAPMRAVSAARPGARAQVVMNFLTQLASDIKTQGISTVGQLRDLLMKYKKTTASVVVSAIITAILVAIGLQQVRSRVPLKEQLEAEFKLSTITKQRTGRSPQRTGRSTLELELELERTGVR